MDDWLDRAKKMSNKPDEPVVESDADLKQQAKDAEDKAHWLTRQTAYSRQLAGDFQKVLEELSQVLAGTSAYATIEEHHKRLMSVKGEIDGVPIVVNILALPKGQVRVTCFFGKDATVIEEDFELVVKAAAIRAWFGDQLVDHFEVGT